MATDFINKMVIKKIAPLLKTFIEPSLENLIQQKNKIELQENEVEACILLQEKNGKIIASAPIFDRADRITRYIPLDGANEAVNLSELILSFINK